MHKRNLALLITNIVLLGVLFIGFCVSPSKTTFSVQKSILLNTKYRDNINYLEFRNPQNMNSLIIRELNNIWYGESELLGEGDKLVFPIDDKLITQFIENVSTLRDLYKVSESFSSYESFGLSEESAFNIKIGHDSIEDSMNIYSDLYFGINDFTQNNIFLRTNNKNVYKTKDNLSSYFSIDPEYWVDHELFCDYLQINKDEIQKISVQYKDRTIILNPKDEQFNNMLTRYLGFRGTSINNKHVIQDYELFCKIAIEDSLSEYVINIFATEDKDRFYCLPDSKNLSFNYVLELSSYTIGRFDINTN